MRYESDLALPARGHKPEMSQVMEPSNVGYLLLYIELVAGSLVKHDCARENVVDLDYTALEGNHEHFKSGVDHAVLDFEFVLECLGCGVGVLVG